MRVIGTAGLVVLTSLGLGCSGLPDSAAPKGGVVAASELDDSDVIPYRALTRADFRGTSVPGPFAAVADRVGAATCGQVRTTDDTQIFVQGVTSPGGETRYSAKVKRLRFRALMDRSCSWWNDKVAAFAPDYVLEHEQIHFALYELGARKLNEQVEDLIEDVENEGSDVESVQAHAEGAINGALEDAVGEILDQNREFDEDTSLGYQPARQKEWLSSHRSARRDGALGDSRGPTEQRFGPAGFRAGGRAHWPPFSDDGESRHVWVGVAREE
jgi:hypothetical protein